MFYLFLKDIYRHCTICAAETLSDDKLSIFKRVSKSSVVIIVFGM